jgi:hypothetical protein
MLHVFSTNVVKVEKVWPARFLRRLFIWDGAADRKGVHLVPCNDMNQINSTEIIGKYSMSYI